MPCSDAIFLRAHALVSSSVHLPVLQKPASFALADACFMSCLGSILRESAMRLAAATSVSALVSNTSASALSAFLHTVGHTDGTISLAIAPSGAGSCSPSLSAHARRSSAVHPPALQNPASIAAFSARFSSASLFVRSVAATSDAAAAAVDALPASALT